MTRACDGWSVMSDLRITHARFPRRRGIDCLSTTALLSRRGARRHEPCPTRTLSPANWSRRWNTWPQAPEG